MRSMTATEAKQSFGLALETAQREPVMIQKRDRTVAVLISAAEYDKLRGIRVKAFSRLCDEIAAEARARGFRDEDLEALMSDVS